MLLSIPSPTEVADVLSRSILSAHLSVSLVAAERLAFTVGPKDEGESPDASLSNSDTVGAFVVNVYWPLLTRLLKPKWPPIMNL